MVTTFTSRLDWCLLVTLFFFSAHQFLRTKFYNYLCTQTTQIIYTHTYMYLCVYVCININIPSKRLLCSTETVLKWLSWYHVKNQNTVHFYSRFTQSQLLIRLAPLLCPTNFKSWGIIREATYYEPVDCIVFYLLTSFFLMVSKKSFKELFFFLNYT